MKTGFVTITAAFLAIFLVSPSLYAQSKTNQSALMVSPAITEQILEPGKEDIRKVVVTNTTNFPLPIKGTVKNFTAFEGVSAKDKKLYDASSWFTLAEPDFILQPKQSKSISLSVTAPTGSEPGGHYATVFFQPVIPADVLSKNTSYLSARVGVLALLIVKGDLAEKVVLSDPETAGTHQKGPIPITVKVKNTGNVHQLPSGKVDILDQRGKRVASLDLPLRVILPKTERTFTVNWDNKGKLGRFQAKASLVYGAEQVKLESKSDVFWVAPWHKALLVLIILTLAIAVIKKTYGRWRKALKELFGSPPLK